MSAANKPKAVFKHGRLQSNKGGSIFSMSTTGSLLLLIVIGVIGIVIGIRYLGESSGIVWSE